MVAGGHCFRKIWGNFNNYSLSWILLIKVKQILHIFLVIFSFTLLG